MKVCPLCAEYAPADAQFCKWCGIRVIDRVSAYRSQSLQSDSHGPIRILSIVLLGLVLLNGVSFWITENRSTSEALFRSRSPSAVSSRSEKSGLHAIKSAKHLDMLHR